MVGGNDAMGRHWRDGCWSCGDSVRRVSDDRMDDANELAIMGFIYLCIGAIVVIVLMFKEVKQ